MHCIYLWMNFNINAKNVPLCQQYLFYLFIYSVIPVIYLLARFNERRVDRADMHRHRPCFLRWDWGLLTYKHVHDSQLPLNLFLFTSLKSFWMFFRSSDCQKLNLKQGNKDSIFFHITILLICWHKWYLRLVFTLSSFIFLEKTRKLLKRNLKSN